MSFFEKFYYFLINNYHNLLIDIALKKNSPYNYLHTLNFYKINLRILFIELLIHKLIIKFTKI